MDPTRQTTLDAENARKATSFDVEKVTHFLHGKDAWGVRQKILDIISSDPVFDKSRRPFLSRAERYDRGLAITKRMGELKDIHEWSDFDYIMALSLLEYALPVTLHYVAFLPVLLSQGSAKQVSKYGLVASNMGIIGSYAQTELGHGSNIQCLETTATYIPETQEFEIHSPTLTSTKWWVGALGKTATHSIVQAQLILPGGKNMGPHLFLVQLRSLEDHKIMKGITLGDIGPKPYNAFTALDNGYGRFDKVRIPREAMLSKFASVTPEGKYLQPPHSKLSYGGMIYIRSSMISHAGWTLGKGVTIAIRYATVRRQGGQQAQGDKLERQVITYPSVHYRLFPLLAKSYVFVILGRSMTKLFQSMSSRLASGDTSLLAETHAISSGLKVLASTQNVEGLEIARRSLGGHGFHAAAGVGSMWAEAVPSTTYEGDNFVLDQQVVRSSLRSLQAFKSHRNMDKLSPSSYFLRHLSSAPFSPTSVDWKNVVWLVEILERRATAMVQSYAQNSPHVDAGADTRVSRAVTEAFVAARVGDVVNELDATLPGKEGIAVRKLMHLWLLTTIESSLADILSFFNLTTSPGAQLDPTSGLRLAISKLCLEILPDAIGLTDAFGFTDFELESVLGVKNGNVYEELMKSVKSEPLNHVEVVPGYQKHIKLILERGQVKARL